MRKLLLLITMICMINLVLAVPSIHLNTTTNYSTFSKYPIVNMFSNVSMTNVNSSDYWDNLNTPADINHNQLGNLAWSVAGHTIDANLEMNLFPLRNVSEIIGYNETFVIRNSYPSTIRRGNISFQVLSGGGYDTPLLIRGEERSIQGFGSIASGTGSFAWGGSSGIQGGTASGQLSFAHGQQAAAEATSSFSVGLSTNATGALPFGIGSIALGYRTTASNGGTLSAGAYNLASGLGATAIGGGITQAQGNIASGTASFAVGENAEASATNSIAIGHDVTNAVGNSFAVGFTKKNFHIANADAWFNVTGNVKIYNSTGWGTIEYGSAITHTEINNNTDVLEKYKDGNDLYMPDGSINYSAFGDCYYRSEDVDYSRPEYRSVRITNIADKEQFDNLSKGEKQTVAPNYNIDEENGIIYVITYDGLETYYPHTYLNEGVDVTCEGADARQTFALLNKNMNLFENITEFDTGIMAEDIYTQSKVINVIDNYALKFLDGSSLSDKLTHKNKEIINLPDRDEDVLNMEDRIVDLEGAFNDHMFCMYKHKKYDDYRNCMLDVNPKDK